MSAYGAYLYGLDDEIRDFARECQSEQNAADARSLAEHLIGGHIGIDRAERELSRLREKEEDIAIEAAERALNDFGQEEAA